MTYRRFIDLVLLVALAGSAVVTPARADGARVLAANEEGARAAFAEGLRLRDTAKEPRQALPKFESAYRLAPTVRTAYELARTHQELGHVVAARRLYAEIGSMPPDPLQTPEGKAAREDAARRLADLEGKIPRLSVKIEGLLTGEAPPTVTVDGAPFDATEPQLTDPGPHVIKVVRADGTQRTREIDLRGRRTEQVTIDMAGGLHAGTRWSAQKTVAITLGAVGGLSLVTSFIVGLSAGSRYDDARRFACGAAVGATSDAQCSPDGLERIESAGASADVATVLFLMGTAAAGTGAVLWLTAPRDEAGRRTGMAMRFGARGVSLGGAF